MFNKMFGGFAQSLMGMVQKAMPDPPQMGRIGWYGLQPKKIIPAGPPAQYASGQAGDINRRRAVKRMDRWIRSNDGAAGMEAPRHIFDNFRQAVDYRPEQT